jgi:hypothetical protein
MFCYLFKLTKYYSKLSERAKVTSKIVFKNSIWVLNNAVYFILIPKFVDKGWVKMFRKEYDKKNSVADPDLGSGIRCLFDPWIRDPESFFSGSRIPNPYF